MGNSREVLAAAPPEETIVDAIPLPAPVPEEHPSVTVEQVEQPLTNGHEARDPQSVINGKPHTRRSAEKRKKDPFSDRKPISEVLHDIYDRNVQ